MEFLWTAAAFIIVLLWSYLTLKEDRTSALINKLPGPKAYPIVGNFFDEFAHKSDIMWKIRARAKKYSPIYRIWHGPVPVVYVSAPEIFEKILGSSSNHLGKGYFYKFLMPWLGTGLLTSEGSKWFIHRKMLTSAFHHRILNRYLATFHENSQVLMGKLQEKANSGETFDIYPLMSLCTLDIICESAMGIKVSAQSHTSIPYVTAIYRVLHLTKERFLRFWLFPDWVYFATKAGREYRQQVDVLHAFANRIIHERRALMKVRKESLIPTEELEIGVTKKTRAFLDLILREAEKENSQHLSHNDIREEVDTFAFEGHETTAVAICWTLLLLGLNQDIQERAFKEQMDIFGEAGDRPPTMKDLTDMKLLERIIKETARIYPSIPLIARIPDDDIHYDKYIIPKGTTVILNIYHLHRNAEIYPDPERFDPERFLPENSCKRHPYAHVPFSAGSRNCIGQKFAMLEEKVILSTIIRNYRVESMQKISDIELVHELLLKSKDGVKIKVFERKERPE